MSDFVTEPEKGRIVRAFFDSTAKATGAPIAATGGTAKCIENGATNITAGVTLTLNVGGVTGRNMVEVDTSNAAYIAESDYTIAVDGMTIDGETSNYTLGTFVVRIQSIDSILGSSFVSLNYKWLTATTNSDPGSGNVKANNATYASVTAFYISDTADAGHSIATFINELYVGQVVAVGEDKNSTNRIIATVTALPTDNTGWYTIPVTVTSSNGLIANNKAVDFGALFLSQGWTPEEKEQFRYRGQIDGNQTAPTTDAPAQMPVAAQVVGDKTGYSGVVTSGTVTTVSGNVNGSVGSVTDPVTVGTNNDKTGYSGTVTGGTVDSVTGNVGGNVVGSVGSVVAPVTAGTVTDKTGYSLAADQSAVTIGTVTTNTDMRGTDGAMLAGSLVTIDYAALVPEGYSINGATPTHAQILHETRQNAADFAIAGAVLTVNKADGVTPAMAFALDDPINPTSRTRTS